MSKLLTWETAQTDKERQALVDEVLSVFKEVSPTTRGVTNIEVGGVELVTIEVGHHPKIWAEDRNYPHLIIRVNMRGEFWIGCVSSLYHSERYFPISLETLSRIILKHRVGPESIKVVFGDPGYSSWMVFRRCMKQCWESSEPHGYFFKRYAGKAPHPTFSIEAGEKIFELSGFGERTAAMIWPQLKSAGLRKRMTKREKSKFSSELPSSSREARVSQTVHDLMWNSELSQAEIIDVASRVQ